MSKQRVRVGDIFQIPLSDGRVAYGQYVYRDKKHGPIIRVFDFISETETEFDKIKEQLAHAKLLFPPVITGVFAAVRTGLWKVVGRLPVNDFEYPNFINVLDENYQPISDWFLVTKDDTMRLGKKLPKKYKHLELLVVWSPYDVVHRIETGENPYREMIERG
jgi:hypothetical protein